MYPVKEDIEMGKVKIDVGGKEEEECKKKKEKKKENGNKALINKQGNKGLKEDRVWWDKNQEISYRSINFL